VAATIKKLLHGRIAREFEYAARAAERVNALTCENEACVSECIVQDREVAARDGDTAAEILRWSCA
jgi:hypothetical protein